METPGNKLSYYVFIMGLTLTEQKGILLNISVFIIRNQILGFLIPRRTCLNSKVFHCFILILLLITLMATYGQLSVLNFCSTLQMKIFFVCFENVCLQNVYNHLSSV